MTGGEEESCIQLKFKGNLDRQNIIVKLEVFQDAQDLCEVNCDCRPVPSRWIEGINCTKPKCWYDVPPSTGSFQPLGIHTTKSTIVNGTLGDSLNRGAQDIENGRRK